MTAKRWLLTSALMAAGACSAPGGPGTDEDWTPKPTINPDSIDAHFSAPVVDTGAAGPSDVPTDTGNVISKGRCTPVKSAEKLPPLSSLITVPVVPEPDTTGTPITPATPDPAPPAAQVLHPLFVSELYGMFKAQCGTCHGSANQGMFSVTQATFVDVMTKRWTDVKNDLSADVTDPDTTPGLIHIMPPTGLGAKARNDSDAVSILWTRLQLWDAWGKPADVFYDTKPQTEPKPAASLPAADPMPPMTRPPDTEKPSFLVSETVASQLSNIGSCIPEKSMIGSAGDVMDALDAKFAAMSGFADLPKNLTDTDLTSLDGEVQAKHGLVGFVPTYPLWSENSAKMRVVRVPRGTSIKFNKATQQFDIPPNTRFYKTFLKPIKDLDGNLVFRKIETRLIVSRPDEKQADGTYKVMALFGTYLWSEDETTAVLHEDRLNDRSEFADKLVTYITNELKAKEIRDSKPKNLAFALGPQNPGLVRHYAIPGKQRCIECHMGAANRDFVLGFTPLQVNRRPGNEGGVYETAGADELDQLQRFIDYGLITGMVSPADVTKLEDSQGKPDSQGKGSRRPREGGYELAAQAYLVGNCAHCHNPKGFPSKNADLAKALDFLPSENGGIFQFKLEVMSPLRSRGANGNVPIPYITPSLRDIPLEYNNTKPIAWTPKYLKCDDSGIYKSYCAPPNLHPNDSTFFLDAPWRSLIYRNVDTPFIYVDDSVLFPHMPRDTAGFDCRAPRILGDWMVSIPAKRKNEVASEDAVFGDMAADRYVPLDTEPQPYVEVAPGDPGFAAAKAAATARLAKYREGKRYSYCPDTSDIVDPKIIYNPDAAFNRSDSSILDSALKNLLVIEDGVPNRPHWVVTDLTDVPGPWAPRRPDWSTVLLKPTPELYTDGKRIPTDPSGVDVTTQLRPVTIKEDFRTFATTKMPMALWQVKPECDFTKPGLDKKVSDFSGPQQTPPRWFAKMADNTKPLPPGLPAFSPDAPVMSLTPGEAVFAEICVNCHGQQADSKGILAAALAEITGGVSRVANFRSGFFGPIDHPGDNQKQTFVPFAQANPPGSKEDWAARYMTWMALGGTKADIPLEILGLVGRTPVFGTNRVGFAAPKDANMLASARQLCAATLMNDEYFKYDDKDRIFSDGNVNYRGLVQFNGDYDLWPHLCNFGNRPVVRVLTLAEGTPAKVRINNLYWGDNYPASAPIMNQHGTVETGLKADNLFPLCYMPDAVPQPGGVNLIEERANDAVHGAPGKVPPCPLDWIHGKQADGTPTALRIDKYYAPGQPFTPDHTVPVDQNIWAARGAMNAGLAVFLYLQDLIVEKKPAMPAFNQCEQLGKLSQ